MDLNIFTDIQMAIGGNNMQEYGIKDRTGVSKDDEQLLQALNCTHYIGS